MNERKKTPWNKLHMSEPYPTNFSRLTRINKNKHVSFYMSHNLTHNLSFCTRSSATVLECPCCCYWILSPWWTGGSPSTGKGWPTIIQCVDIFCRHNVTMYTFREGGRFTVYGRELFGFLGHLGLNTLPQKATKARTKESNSKIKPDGKERKGILASLMDTDFS